MKSLKTIIILFIFLILLFANACSYQEVNSNIQTEEKSNQISDLDDIDYEAQNDKETLESEQAQSINISDSSENINNIQKIDNIFYCSMSIRCNTIISNMESLKETKIDLIPKNGIIFNKSEVIFYQGETVFDVLIREMKNASIHLEFMNTLGNNTVYIEGINNIYELDCGPLSGWMYRVNGVFPNYGCSFYQLNPDDQIEWLYTCDLGADIGGTNASGQRK